MSLLLKNSEKFQKDVLLYKDAIQKIKLPKNKIYFTSLLQKFIEYSKFIDSTHDTKNNGYIKPNRAQEYIIEMIKIRKEFSKLLKDIKEH